ncbi:MAG TPA: hypothetical protein VI248_07430 [Kineosporiaceae bacterium]
MLSVGLTPESAFIAVVAAVYVNQVLFTVYVTAVHRGDPWFVARYLPPGWFAIPRGRFWSALAGVWPHPELLAASVLRVQAVLELPLVVLAYLAVARRLGPDVAAGLARPWPLWSACAAYSFTFGWIELGLRNPWTGADLVLRAASMLVTAPLVGLLLRPGLDRHARTAVPHRRSAVGFLCALAGAGALAMLVLIVYDTALLYNLARLPGQLPAAGLAVASLAATARVGPPDPCAASGPRLAVLVEGLRRLVSIVFVPALTLRYGMVYFGSAVAACALAALAAVAAAQAAFTVGTRVLADSGREAVRRWLAGLVVAALASVAAAGAGWTMARQASHTEVRMLAAVLAALLTAVASLAAADALDRHRTRRATHRPAD